MSEQKKFNKSLFDALMSEELPEVTFTGGTHSFRIVNSNGNGKRVELSKTLSERLALADVLHAMPSRKDGKLVIGKELPFPSKAKLTLSGSDRKIAYSAPFVKLLAEMFNIDFKKHVSRTFKSIEFDSIDEVPVAIIDLTKLAPVKGVQAEETV